MRILLETERLVLRAFDESDVDNLLALNSDPDVVRYVTLDRSIVRDVLDRDVLPRYLGYHRRWPSFGMWAAIDRATGEFVGWFLFKPADGDPDDDVEIGYRLRREYWGRGLATEGVRALVDRGFAELGVRRMWANAMAVNSRSWRVMEKAGMRYVRTFYEEAGDSMPGAEQGEVEYALTREQWRPGSQDTVSRGTE